MSTETGAIHLPSKSMLNHLYRFRSTHALLDGHEELEFQQIYFCPPDQLNDPLEGFKDVFWRGDKVVWRNLLRHYILNLMQATSNSAIMGKEFKPDLCASFVHLTDDDLPQAPIRDSYSAACLKFFDHPAVEHLVSAYSSQKRTVRRDELIFYLRIIHPLAIRVVFAAFWECGLLAIQPTTVLDEMIESMNQKLQDALRINAQAEEISDVLYSASESIQSQLALIHEFNTPVAEERRSLLFLMRDFSDFYVTALERLLHPNWHVACFVSNPSNASMWGTYADSHRGVCLKFKILSDIQGVRTLDLYREKSWDGGKDEIVANCAYVPHRFEEIQYTAEFPEIDFFESIAILPRYKLEGFWFTDPHGERSTTASRMLSEDAAWRQEYWLKFATSFSTKTSDWQHEEEQRLILQSSLQRFDEPESRKLKYRFADLSGIIFGIKTTVEDKLRIMRIIERKCMAEGRQEFEFHQAYYSHQSKRIEMAPLSLLKVGNP